MGVHLIGMYLIGTYRPASHWHISDGCVSPTGGTVDSLALNPHSNSLPRLGEEGGICRTTSVVRQSLGRAHANPREQGKKEEEKRCLLVARVGLPSYLCWLCTYHVYPSVYARGGITPPQYQLIGTMFQGEAIFLDFLADVPNLRSEER
jgi:hypothetical protein